MAHPPSLTGKLSASLYNDRTQLRPMTFIGPQYAFRTADGSMNNIDDPNLGKAGTPYARVAQQTRPLPPNQLPDAGLVFDTLLRRDKFREHPGGLSSLMFSFSALVVYSVFRTDRRNMGINATSGYLDLSPLYGNDQATQNQIRVRDGRGCLHPDTFAEDRLLLLPPATMAILILFNRNHNYIARHLLQINERGTWRDPSSSPPNSAHWQLIRQDEEIFQIARLCNCAWFAAIAFSDYFSAILGLVHQGSAVSAETFNKATANSRRTEGGRGNARSVEFNCLYRWHVTTSLEDQEWITRQFSMLFPGQDPEKVTVADFYRTAGRVEAMQPDIQHWTFGNLLRQDDGYFRDSDVASILQNSTSHHAASFGARGTPGIMRLYELKGIEAGRRWGVCSLNDFRSALGLKPYSSFYEWNPNATVAEAAERLYGEIDNLELYVGLQAEDTKPITEGFGLCSGYTTSHVVLSDLINLICDDRFYTQDFTPHNMTSWGFADCQRDPNSWGFGSTLGRLLLRTLPDNYDEKSVFTWFPLMHPATMEDYLMKHGKSDEYSCGRPERRNAPIVVSDYLEVNETLKNSQIFVAEFDRAKEIFGFLPIFLDGSFMNTFATSTDAIDRVGQYFYKKSVELISSASYELINTNTKGVDIVRDVLRLVPLHWVASEIACIPLKEKQNQPGSYTPQQLYSILSDIYQFIFLDIEPGKYMVLKRRVQDHIRNISPCIKAALGNRRAGGVTGFASEREKLLNHIFELAHTDEQVVIEILFLMAGITVEVGVALTNILNVLLDTPDYASLRTRANSAETQDHHTLVTYAIEALRIDPSFSGVYRVAKNNHEIGSLKVEQGDRIFLKVANAVMNEEAFPNPTTFDVMRPRPERHLQLDVAFKVIGADTALELVVQVLQSILALDNVCRGPGQSGQLTRYRDDTFQDLCYVYLDAQQHRSPWPTSMIMLYDLLPSLNT